MLVAQLLGLQGLVRLVHQVQLLRAPMLVGMTLEKGLFVLLSHVGVACVF